MKKVIISIIFIFMSVCIFSFTDTELKEDFEKKINPKHIINRPINEKIYAAYDLTDNIFYAMGIASDEIDYKPKFENLPDDLYSRFIYETIGNIKNKLYFRNQIYFKKYLIDNIVNHTKISYFNEASVKFNFKENDIENAMTGASFNLKGVFFPDDETMKKNFYDYKNGKKPNTNVFCKGYMSMDISNIINAFMTNPDFYNQEKNLQENYKGKILPIRTDFGDLEILAPKDAVKCRIIKNENYVNSENKIEIKDGKIYNDRGVVTSIIIDASNFYNSSSEFKLDYCVYPRIRIPNGDVVYSAVLDLYDPNKVSYASYINKDDTETLNTREGSNPLKIKPFGIAGIPGSMCDIVLSENDACLYINYMKHMHIVSKYDMLKHANYLTEKYNDIPHFLFAENVTDLRGNTIQNSGDSSNGRSVFCVLYSAISGLFNPKKPVCKIL